MLNRKFILNKYETVKVCGLRCPFLSYDGNRCLLLNLKLNY